MSKRSGFTLLELSIVIVVLSIMAGGLLAVITQETRRTKMAELNMKMDAIETALRAFVVRNSRLPCPAGGTVNISDTTNFGKEFATPGTCTGADYTDGVTTVVGTVAVRALGLPDEYMFDPWGGRFTYAIDMRATATAFSTYGYASDNYGSITVKDGGGNTRATNAVLAIISHGPNGHGAYQLNGARKITNSVNTNELLNCHCTSTGTVGLFGAPFTIVMGTNAISSGDADITHGFDDIVRYYTREQFLTATIKLNEKL